MMSSFVGSVVFFGILHYAWRSQSWRWRALAAVYAGDPPDAARATKKLQTLLLFGGQPLFTSYRPVTVGVHEDGISLRLLPPFSVYHPRLFLPFADMRVTPSSWHLNAESFSIRCARCEAIEMIVDGALLDWIRSVSGKP